jgi:CubicO group peptidase (beta-lactamase class C family)
MNDTIGPALCRLFSEDALMRKYNGYLSVKQGETLLFEGGYGYADVQNDVRATGDTIYLIGSMTKPITATCIMMLENQGLLSLDDTITSYFPDYSAADRVTVRHLLTQTSGLPDYWNKVGISSIDYTDVNAIFDFIKTFELVCKPGEAFQYCNSNYLVLGMLIEKIMGETYLEYARAYL